LYYFMPGQVIFQVSRAAAATDQQVMAAVQDQINAASGQTAIQAQTAESLDSAQMQVVDRPSADDQNRAAVVVDLGFDKTGDGITSLLQGVGALRSTVSASASGNVNIEDIGLNWLTSGAQGIGGGTGGPGAHPVEADAPANAFSDNLTAEFSFIKPEEFPANGSLKEVNIAVLDTAPPLPLLAARFDELVLQKLAAGTQHPVLHRLLGSSAQFNTSLSADGNFLTVSGNGLPNANLSFRISYNIAQDSDGRVITDTLVNHASNIEIEHHAYLMSDHGLFIAGNIARLIQGIAPSVKVNLHLIQVLGDYGIGTLQMIQQGLKWALDSGVQAKPMVINASLMLNVPRDVGHKFDLSDLGLPQSVINDILALVTPSMNLLAGDFAAAADDSRYDGVNIIAAAGNDSLPGLPQVRARYPAAFDKVIGVEARNIDMSVAPYSNLRDNPLTDGSRAKGGDVVAVADGWEAAAIGGQVGTYIGEFPTATGMVPSANGWGAWAGTSFAAPRVSAAVALLRAKGKTADEATTDVAIP
jgi:hypothetical protein